MITKAEVVYSTPKPEGFALHLTVDDAMWLRKQVGEMGGGQATRIFVTLDDAMKKAGVL